MSVDIKFTVDTSDERSGVVAENAYLWDAARRLGLFLKAECGGRGACDTCAVTVTRGAELLSAPTTSETEILTLERLAKNERLACQARLERAGEVELKVSAAVATNPANEPPKERNFREEFQKLPRDKKFATLVQLEAIALNESLSFITNLPYTIGNQVVGLLATLGLRQEAAERTARRPAEHQPKVE